MEMPMEMLKKVSVGIFFESSGVYRILMYAFLGLVCQGYGIDYSFDDFSCVLFAISILFCYFCKEICSGLSCRKKE